MQENGKSFGEIANSLNISEGNAFHYYNKNNTTKKVPHRGIMSKTKSREGDLMIRELKKDRTKLPRKIKAPIFGQNGHQP